MAGVGGYSDASCSVNGEGNDMSGLFPICSRTNNCSRLNNTAKKRTISPKRAKTIPRLDKLGKSKRLDKRSNRLREDQS